MNVKTGEGGLLIGGQISHEGGGGRHSHINPHTGAVQPSVPLAGADDVDRAVLAARAAFDDWRAWSPDRRRDVLLRLADLLRVRAEELAAITALEMGMPVSFGAMACGSMPVEYFSYYAGWAEKLDGQVISTYPGDQLNYTVRVPYGVIAVIIGWNGPMGSISMKVAPALGAGNCVVIKPPELTPFTPLLFGELCLEAGIPPGVVNVIPSNAAGGDALVRHPGVSKISFTGGNATAKYVMAGAAENLTPMVLELGGKSASIIFPDADIADAIARSSYMGCAALSGQACSLPTRLLLHEDIYEDAITTVVQTLLQIQPGDPSNPSTIMGPVASLGHLNRIVGVIDEAVARGDGKRLLGRAL